MGSTRVYHLITVGTTIPTNAGLAFNTLQQSHKLEQLRRTAAELGGGRELVNPLTLFRYGWRYLAFHMLLQSAPRCLSRSNGGDTQNPSWDYE